MSEGGEWTLRPGDLITVYPEMVQLRRPGGYYVDDRVYDISLPKGFLPVLESLIRAVAMGETEMVYLVGDTGKEVTG